MSLNNPAEVIYVSVALPSAYSFYIYFRVSDEEKGKVCLKPFLGIVMCESLWYYLAFILIKNLKIIIFNSGSGSKYITIALI